MTIAEFLDLLEDGSWHLDAGGNLSDENDYCPLWYAYYRFHDEPDEEGDGELLEDYVEAGRRCGLRTRDAVAIAQAADNRGHPRLRRKILARLGIVDPRPPAAERNVS